MTLTAHALLPKSGKPPTSIVVFLHGVGSNGQDLVGIAPMWANALPDTLFVSPDAPDVCDMNPGYPNSYQWFSLADRSPPAMWRGVTSVEKTVDGFLDGLLETYRLEASRLALVGFSQGTMTSLHMATHRKEPLAAIVGYSGALLPPPDGALSTVSRSPILLVHGDDDGVVPVEAMPRAEAALSGLGFPVETLMCPGVGHTIDQRGLKAGMEFLQAHLEG